MATRWNWLRAEHEEAPRDVSGLDGRRIAYRGRPHTSEAGRWVSIVPGYTVLDERNGIEVYFDGKIVH
jgi:hypothetical protein